jgi:ABC-type lipoprotein export system ATPase subunit
VVLVTHDMRIAERADRILTIRDGVVESDTRTPVRLVSGEQARDRA